MSNSNNRNQVKEVSLAFLIPMLAAIVLVPLIVRIHVYDPKISEYAWYTSETTKMDVFHYWKNYWFSILGGVMACFAVLLFFKEGKLPVKKMFLPLAVYALMCILSTIFSVSRYHSIHGFYEMFESIFCLLSYCMLCYYAFLVIRTEKSLKTAAVFVLVGAALLGIVGTSQYFGKDIIMSEFGKKLMLPESYGPDYGLYPEKLSLSFGIGRVYETLYNPNYVGVYTAMILPFLLVLTVTVDHAKKLIVYVPLIILTMFSLVGSLSRAGMIAIIGSIVLLLVMFYKMIVKYWKQACGIVLLLVIGIVGFDFARDHVISQRFLSIFQSGGEEEAKQSLESIKLDKDHYTMKYNGHELTIQAMPQEGSIVPLITDEAGTQLSLSVETAVTEDGEEYNYYLISDSGYEGMVLQPAYSGENLGIQYIIDNFEYFIYYSEEDGAYVYQNGYGKKSDITSSETADWKIFRMFGGFSGRGYIWSKSVPLLKKYLFLGCGPDTYTFVFPHTDYISANYNGYENQIITKPHSMYLQTAIQTGMVSLIAWLVFYVWYFVDSFRLYFRREYVAFSEKLGVGIMIATASYMISGIANDSNPSVAPIYWGLLGIGIAANTIVRRTRKEEEERAVRKKEAIEKAKAMREQKRQTADVMEK